MAEIVRSVGLPLLAVFAVYMIIKRISWRKVAATIVVCLVPVFGYAGLFYAEHGQFAMTDSTGVFLYSRVMTFADCTKMTVPANELSLCTTVPPDKRPIAQAYIWTTESPLDRFPPSKFSPVPNQLAENFAISAIKAQPLDYAKAVFHDTWRVFGWKRVIFPNAPTYDEYIFGYRSLPVPAWDRADLGPYDSYAAAYVHGDPLTHVVAPFANVIRGYQRYVWLPGSVYGLILLAGLGGMVLAWRRLGGEALLPWTISLALIVIPAATAEFDYRYVLVAVPFACLAAALAFSPGTAGGKLARRLGTRLGQRGQRGQRRARSLESETPPSGSGRRRRRAAPATTSVISPRTAPDAFFFLVSRGSAPLTRAAQSASSASVPRLISSWVLVSSRHTTAGRSSPCEPASSASVAASLRPASKKTWVRRSAASSAKRRARSPWPRGGNPSKLNRSVGSPETASAVVTADGPGRAVTRSPAVAAAETSR